MMASNKLWRLMPSQQRTFGIRHRFQTTTPTKTTGEGNTNATADAAASSSTSASPPSTAMSRAKERAAEKAAAETKRQEMLEHARQEMTRYRLHRPPNEAVLARKHQSRAKLNKDLRIQLMVGAVLVGLIALAPGLGKYFAGKQPSSASRLQQSYFVVSGEDDDDDDDDDKNKAGVSSQSGEGSSDASTTNLTFGQVLLAAQHDLHERAKRGELSPEKLEAMRSYLPDSFDEYMPESKHKTMSNDVYTKWRPRTIKRDE
jgi:hypothetical protein